MTTTEYDPVTLEIARHRLESIAEEVGAALVRTAYSPNIKDRRDCSAGVYTPAGELVAQAEHIPLHLGLMPEVVRAVLAEVPLARLGPGDAIVTNDPFIGGSHLPDLCVISPVFAGDEPIALVANLAHHVDVGGLSPGSIPVGVTEIYQEGLRIPPVFLAREGEVQHDVVALLLANIRTETVTRGDLTAQLAANALGARRLGELHAAWGAEGLAARQRWLIEYGERRAREAVAALPRGEAAFTDRLEHSGREPVDIPIHAAVRIGDGEVEVDLRDSAPQVAGSVNCSRAVTLACAAFAVKAISDPALPSNAGSMRAIALRTTPGTVVDARLPAAVSSGNINTAQRIVDAILGALAQIVPERTPAASAGSMSIVTVGGVDPRGGEYYSYVETYAGGQGALPALDGADGVHTNMTNTRNTPCEVIEREYPLRVRRYALVPDSGGAGRRRGGTGLLRELELTRGEAQVTASTERLRHRPWGLGGGGPGAPSRVVVVTAAEGERELGAMGSARLAAGDRLVIRTPGGAGHGPPGEREEALAREDLAEGLVTEAGR